MVDPSVPPIIRAFDGVLNVTPETDVVLFKSPSTNIYRLLPERTAAICCQVSSVKENPLSTITFDAPLVLYAKVRFPLLSADIALKSKE